MIFDVIGSLLGFIAYAFLINFFFSDGLAQFRLIPQAIVTVALLCLAVALNMLFSLKIWSLTQILWLLLP